MGLREWIVLAIVGFAAAPVATANEVKGTTPDGSTTQLQEARSGVGVPPAPEPAAQASPLDPLEPTRLSAEPIAHLKRFEPGMLRPMAGPTFLVGPWQQQLFFQRSIDPRNPYYGTGLTR